MHTPIFSGEMQLLRWAETSTGGATVTFQLSDVSELNRFKDLTIAKKGMAGQRIAAVMMQFEDDAEPEPVPEVKQKLGMLCIMACTFCADKQFWLWCARNSSFTGNEQGAKELILATCGVDSRKKLDTDRGAAALFHSYIREPYMAWRGAQ